MAITPDEIEKRVFALVRKGYDPAEVDDFLKAVADAFAEVQSPATPPVAEPPAAAAPAPVQPDDYNRLGEEVAAILRQAHDSVEELRHRAEAEAALIRQTAQREADELTRRADADRQAAAIELEAARDTRDRILADVQRQAERAAEVAEAGARQCVLEVIEAARAEARGAVIVQRNVRGRLEQTRDHIDQALDRLVEEDTDLFATIDLTDAAMDEAGDDDGGDDDGGDDDGGDDDGGDDDGGDDDGGDDDGGDDDGGDDDGGDDDNGGGPVPPPGQRPPTPPVPPPSLRTTPGSTFDLPYAEDDDEDDDDSLVVDLTDEDGDDDGGGLGAAPADRRDPDDDGGASADVPVGPTNEADSDDDALSQMVKNAVENALRRRKGDGEPPAGDPV